MGYRDRTGQVGIGGFWKSCAGHICEFWVVQPFCMGWSDHLKSIGGLSAVLGDAIVFLKYTVSYCKWALFLSPETAGEKEHKEPLQAPPPFLERRLWLSVWGGPSLFMELLGKVVPILLSWLPSHCFHSTGLLWHMFSRWEGAAWRLTTFSIPCFTRTLPWDMWCLHGYFLFCIYIYLQHMQLINTPIQM